MNKRAVCLFSHENEEFVYLVCSVNEDLSLPPENYIALL